MTQMQKTMAVFSGSVNPSLADGIAKELGLSLGNVKLEKFANGEIYARYGESVRGADVFIVQSVSAGSSYDVNDALIYAEGFLLIGVVCIDLMCQSGESKVHVHMGRDKYDLRANLPCLPESHAGLYSGLLCQLILCQHDAMSCLRISTDSERSAAKLRVMEEFNTGVAVIHIRMKNCPHFFLNTPLTE